MKIIGKLDELKLIRPLYGGVLSAVFIFLGSYMVGHLGSWEARVNIQEMRPSLRFICSAVLTATSTILALLLTLISFSTETNQPIKSQHFMRIQWIASLCTVAFISAIVMLTFLTLPLENSDSTLATYYDIIYYVLLVCGALLAGFMISIVLMLYEAAHAIILIFNPARDANHLLKEAGEKGDEIELEVKGNNKES